MLIDTHIWIWWVNGDSQLKPEHEDAINAAQRTGIGVSIISCWEVAKLVENKRLLLTLPRYPPTNVLSVRLTWPSTSPVADRSDR